MKKLKIKNHKYRKQIENKFERHLEHRIAYGNRYGIKGVFPITFSLLTIFIASVIGVMYVWQIVLLPDNFRVAKRESAIMVAKDLCRYWQETSRRISHPDKLSESDGSILLQDEIKRLSDTYNLYITIQIPQSYGPRVWNYSYEPSSFTSKIRYDSDIMNSDEFIASIDEKTGVNIAYLAESGNYAETPEDSFYIRVTSAVDGMIRPDESGIIPPAYVMVTGVSRPSDDVYYIIKNQFFRSSLILVAAAIAMAFTISYFVANPIVQLKNSIPPLAKGKFAFNPKHAWYSEIASLGIVLESVNSEIARTEEIRRGLFANVSHDLRTPLTMVRAYAEKMLDFDDPDTRKEDLNVIVGEVLRLNTLVTDILDISKLESGAEKLNLELFNFSSMLTDIATRFSYLSEQNITVVADVSPDILITADRPKIERVIYNLVYNAINYGKPNGNTITLKISADERLNDKLIFQITDNGRGIAEDKLAFIWDRYYKADKSDNHTRLSRGTGLGLSIVKNILELHGYEYGALSEEDVGTTVWFTLPRGDYAAVAKLPF